MLYGNVFNSVSGKTSPSRSGYVDRKTVTTFKTFLYMGGCGCLTEARVSFCLTLSICPVNCAEVDSLIPRDLRLVLSVFWLISGFAMFKKKA